MAIKQRLGVLQDCSGVLPLRESSVLASPLPPLAPLADRLLIRGWLLTVRRWGTLLVSVNKAKHEETTQQTFSLISWILQNKLCHSWRIMMLAAEKTQTSSWVWREEGYKGWYDHIPFLNRTEVQSFSIICQLYITVWPATVNTVWLLHLNQSENSNYDFIVALKVIHLFINRNIFTIHETSFQVQICEWGFSLLSR